jgi:hypothetical protein
LTQQSYPEQPNYSNEEKKFPVLFLIVIFISHKRNAMTSSSDETLVKQDLHSVVLF